MPTWGSSQLPITPAPGYPIPSISLPQHTIDTSGREQVITIKGRHDGSVFPRVLPVVESMTALVLVDEMLAQRLVR